MRESSFYRDIIDISAGILAKDIWIYFLILSLTALCLAFLAFHDLFDYVAHFQYFAPMPVVFLVVMPCAAILADISYVVIRFDRRRRLAFRRVFSANRMAQMFCGCMLLMAITLLQGNFTSIKSILPILTGGYRFDVPLADIDAWLHFNRQPGDWLLQLVGSSSLLMRAIELNYAFIWGLLCGSMLFYALTSPQMQKARTRYIIMCLFVWGICGNLVAMLTISAGPVYYGVFTGDEVRFSAHIAALAAGSGLNGAVETQRYLLDMYNAGVAGFGSGISAFPSVHVALILMNVLFLAEKSRIWAAAGGLYTTVILLSSVYLGWHYAVDGYFSIVVVLVAHFALQAVCRAVNPAAHGQTIATRPA